MCKFGLYSSDGLSLFFIKGMLGMYDSVKEDGESRHNKGTGVKLSHKNKKSSVE